MAAFASVSMNAQDNKTKTNGNKPYFGVRAGVQFTVPGEVRFDDVSVDFFKSGAGFEIGGIYNIPIVGKFYIEPGINLFYNSYSFKDYLVESLSTNSMKINSISINKFGMSIPVLAGFQFKFSNGIGLSIFLGPELEIGFSSKVCTKGPNIDISESAYGEDGGMNRVNLLLTTGAGISYKHFVFNFKTSPGLVNMLRDTDAEFNENRVVLTLGYNF